MSYLHLKCLNFSKVAMNYQYPGLAMDLNRGFFLKNGGCGYVLKPPVMREGNTLFLSLYKVPIVLNCFK